jgi:phage gp36-like protein
LAYATQDDLTPLRMTQDELIQLTDDTNSGEVDSDVVSGVLEEASGRVDSYCRDRYKTPLQQSDTVKGLTLDIAVYLLFSRRRNAKLHETIRQRYEDAIAWLKDISQGKAQLDQPQSAATPQTSLGTAVTSGKKLRFRDHHIEGFSS